MPTSARWFLARSTLKWVSGRCLMASVAVGRVATVKASDDVPRLEYSRLGGHPAPYRRHAVGGSTCDRRLATTYSTLQRTRPYDTLGRPRGLKPDQGFYLDILSAASGGSGRSEHRNGQSFIRGVPSYYERRNTTVKGKPGLKLSYWLLFAHSEIPGPKGLPVSSHEGDWERVDVLLQKGARAEQYRPVAVEYHRAGTAKQIVPWADVEGAGTPMATHPVVYAGRGGHTPYPSRGQHRIRGFSYGRRTVTTEESNACADCPQWRTWQNLRSVRAEPWYGFGGGWGLRWERDETSGPLGPYPTG